MSRSAALPAAGRSGSPFRRLLPWLAAVVAPILLSAPRADAHGGPPLRIGVTPDPVVTAVGRLALSHLREGVGFGVDWREFPDERGLRAAFAAGKIDIAVGMTPVGSTLPASAACPPETLARLREDLRRGWGGEVFLLGFPPGPSSCERPALVVSRAVLDDLRFGILGREAARFSTIVAPEDVSAVRSAAERGGERAAAAAARSAMAARAKR